jgi:hypothetical protein
MGNDLYTKAPKFRGRFSFLPLIQKWKQLSEVLPGHFEDLVNEFEKTPELLHPIDEYSILEKKRDLIERTALTILPSTLTNDLATAITPPFSNKIIYASLTFRRQFMDNQGVLVAFDIQTTVNIAEARKALAYKMILEKFYNVRLSGGDAFICVYPNPSEQIFNYFELSWDWQFVDVTDSSHRPSIPSSYFLHVHTVQDLWKLEDLDSILPLEKFVFTGFLLVNIKQVTQSESTMAIRNLLQTEESLDLPGTMPGITEELRYLLDIPHLQAGIISFPVDHANGCFLTQVSSILLKAAEKDQWKTIIEEIKEEFSHNTILFTGNEVKGNILKAVIQQTKWKECVFVGLYNKERLAGCLEIYIAQTPDLHALNARLRAVIGFIEQALEEKENMLQLQINRIVKDNFTALQPVVEWKFNQAAIDYMMQPSSLKHMKPIVFEGVYPLYGMFDIRNSSTERNKAVQQDLIMQLQAVKNILNKAVEQCPLLFLRELQCELEENLSSVNNFLLSGDEETIRSLLKTELAGLLQNLSGIIPLLAGDVKSYEDMLDPATGFISHHQKLFEKRVIDINNHLAVLLDGEQEQAQQIFPHYFERFATDGIEFNMYIGQSITPGRNFNTLYLHNIRLWQLRLLALGARLLNEKLEPGLETTQLVLVYNLPISIRFRTEERKFDVDHIEHTRYEIIKKRIDKAYIRNTNQRLTEPGTISIVYMNDSDVQEYYRYIKFLKKEELLEGTPEKLELEEMQGVSGLKALRVAVKLEQNKKKRPKSQTSAKEVE